MAEAENLSLDFHLDFLLKDLTESTGNNDDMVQCSPSSTVTNKSDCGEPSVILCSQQSYEYPLTQSFVNNLPQQDDIIVTTPYTQSASLSNLHKILENSSLSESESDLEREIVITNLHANSPQYSESVKHKWECNSQPTDSKSTEEIFISNSWPKFNKFNSLCLEERSKDLKWEKLPLKLQFLDIGNKFAHHPVPDNVKQDCKSKRSYEEVKNYSNRLNTPPFFESPKNKKRLNKDSMPPACIEGFTNKFELPSNLCLSDTTFASKCQNIIPIGPLDLDISKHTEANLNFSTDKTVVLFEKQELQKIAVLQCQSESSISQLRTTSKMEENLLTTRNTQYVTEKNVIQPDNEIKRQQVVMMESLSPTAVQTFRSSDLHEQESSKWLIDREKYILCKGHELADLPEISKAQPFSNLKEHEKYFFKSLEQNKSQEVSIDQACLSDLANSPETASLSNKISPSQPLHALYEKDLNIACESKTAISKQQRDIKEAHRIQKQIEEPSCVIVNTSFQSSKAFEKVQEGPEILIKPSDEYATKKAHDSFLNSGEHLNFVDSIDQKQNKSQETKFRKQENLLSIQFYEKNVGNQQPQTLVHNANQLQPVSTAQLQPDCGSYELKQKFESIRDQSEKPMTDQDCFQPSNKYKPDKTVRLIDQEKQKNEKCLQRSPNMACGLSAQLFVPVSQSFSNQCPSSIGGECKGLETTQKQFEFKSLQRSLKSTNAMSNQESNQTPTALSLEGQGDNSDVLNSPKNFSSVSVCQQPDVQPFEFKLRDEEIDKSNLNSNLSISDKVVFLSTGMSKKESNDLSFDNIPESIQKPTDLLDPEKSQEHYLTPYKFSEISKSGLSFVYQQLSQPKELKVQKLEGAQAIQIPQESKDSCVEMINIQHVAHHTPEEFTENLAGKNNRNQGLTKLCSHEDCQSPDKQANKLFASLISHQNSLHQEYPDSSDTQILEGLLNHDQKKSLQTRSEEDEKVIECVKLKEASISTQHLQLQESHLRKNEQTLSFMGTYSQFVDFLPNSDIKFNLKASQGIVGSLQSDADRDKASYNITAEKIIENNQQEKGTGSNEDHQNSKENTCAQLCEEHTLISNKNKNTLDLQIVPINNFVSVFQTRKDILSDKTVDVVVDASCANILINEKAFSYHLTPHLKHGRIKEMELVDVLTNAQLLSVLKTTNGNFPLDQHLNFEDLKPKTQECMKEPHQQAFDVLEKHCNVNVEVYVCSKETQPPLNKGRSQSNETSAKLSQHLKSPALTNFLTYPSNGLDQMQRHATQQMLHIEASENFEFCSPTKIGNWNNSIKCSPCDKTACKSKNNELKSNIVLDVPPQKSSQIVIPKKQMQVCLQDDSVDKMTQNDANHKNQQTVIEPEDHTVPENSISTNTELRDTSFYDDVHKARHALETTRKRAFQWTDVYEATLLQSLSPADSENLSLSQLGPLHPQRQTQRPLRVGLSKKQKVKSLHDR